MPSNTRDVENWTLRGNGCYKVNRCLTKRAKHDNAVFKTVNVIWVCNRGGFAVGALDG